jgi:hypothetical protein
VFPAADGAITLSPHDATLEGPSIRVERVGVIGDVTHNIGYWLDPAATASWPVGVGAVQQGAKMLLVGLLEALGAHQVIGDERRILGIELPLVQALDGEFA